MSILNVLSQIPVCWMNLITDLVDMPPKSKYRNGDIPREGSIGRFL